MSRIPYVIKDTYAGMLYIKVVIILYILYCVNIIVHSLYTGMCDFFISLIFGIGKEKYLCIEKSN